jgi:hypothetical protein
MPRSAATLLGLVLVALSIGFNTVRYPVVWEMVGPARASESAQPAAAKPEQPESPAPPQQPPSPPVKPIEVKPVAEAAEKIKAGGAASTEAKTEDDAASAEPVARKPLVPVAPMISSNAPGSGAGMRRLPPVESVDSNAAVSRDTAAVLNGSIPVYPTTGIE